MMRVSMCLLCMLVFSSGIAWADILIIAYQDVPETTVTKKDLQQIFLGKRVQWKDNSAIHPVTVKEAKFHKAFLPARHISGTLFQLSLNSHGGDESRVTVSG